MTYSRMSKKDSRTITKVAPKKDNTIDYEICYSDELGIQYKSKDTSLFEYSPAKSEQELRKNEHEGHNDVDLSELLLRIKAFTKRITQEMSKNYLTQKLIKSALNKIQNDIYFVTATCNVLECEFTSTSLSAALETEDNPTKKEILGNLLEAAISVEKVRADLEKFPSQF